MNTLLYLYWRAHDALKRRWNRTEAIRRQAHSTGWQDGYAVGYGDGCADGEREAFANLVEKYSAFFEREPGAVLKEGITRDAWREWVCSGGN